MGVSSRNHQGQNRKLKLEVPFLPLFQQHCMDVSLEMIHRDQWLSQAKTESFRIADAHEQSPSQTRALRHSDGINRLIGLPCLIESMTYHRYDSPQMFPGGQLRNHTSKGLVSGDLRV